MLTIPQIMPSNMRSWNFLHTGW